MKIQQLHMTHMGDRAVGKSHNLIVPILMFSTDCWRSQNLTIKELLTKGQKQENRYPKAGSCLWPEISIYKNTIYVALRRK